MVPSLSFNPRVREGRDIVYQIGGDGFTVSIHASVKDATNLIRHTSMI